MKPSAIIRLLIICLFLSSGIHVFAVDPVITVRFANPEYSCTTQLYSVDVEFQSNMENIQLFGMNVRFFYQESTLEFSSFGEFAQGYSAINPYPPTITTGNAAGGAALFGFTGPQEYVNGAVEKTTESTVILSVTGWTKLFNVSFQVDDPAAFNVDSFCPSLVWDLKEGATGGIAAGIVITVVNGTGSAPSIENCVQFNWQYDGVPGLPHGYPANTNCINTICAYAPDTQLPTFGVGTPGTISVPVTVTGFNLISGFNLAFEYDSTVMSYSGYTANSIFTPGNGLLSVSVLPGTGNKKKLLMAYDGATITLADNSQIVNLDFNYITGTTLLTWLSDLNECSYFDAYGHHAYDLPHSDYYLNGKVISLIAPITKIDSLVAFNGNLATFTVRVWDYLNVLSGQLTLNYNSGNLVYVDGTTAPSIPSNFLDNVTSPGTLVLTWSGTGLTLPDSSAIAYLTFQYLGNTSALTWNNTGSACQYVDAELLTAMTDLPTSNYYFNGYITDAQFTWTGSVSSDWNIAGNWSGNRVPGKPVNVLVDAAGNPAFWPVYSGDMVLGEVCNNIDLQGNASLTLLGDLMINPGHSFNFDSGHLNLEGDLVNSGTLDPGTGILEFTGVNPSSISPGIAPETYLSNYQVTTMPKDFTLLEGATIGTPGDDVHFEASIGFDFNFMGTTYNQVRINTNGWLSFNLSGEDAGSFDNTLLFSSEGPTTVLAPWWDNLRTSGVNNMRYITTGTAPDRIFTAEWRNLYSYNSSATCRISFQVKLYESSGIIDFCYNIPIAGTHNNAESASIGIKGLAGGPGDFIEASQNSSYLMVPIYKSTINWPTVNYRFIPAVQSDTEFLYRLTNSKSASGIHIIKDVMVSGTE